MLRTQVYKDYISTSTFQKCSIFIRPFEKRDVLWGHLRRASGRAASKGVPLSKSKSFHQVFIKLGEYVGVYNVSTKFYNQPNLPCTPELWPLNCPKLGFPLSKSKSFCPILIKLGKSDFSTHLRYEITPQTGVREVPGSIPGSGKIKLCLLFLFCFCCVFIYVQKALFTYFVLPFPFAMLIHLVYLHTGKVVTNYKGIRIKT